MLTSSESPSDKFNFQIINRQTALIELNPKSNAHQWRSCSLKRKIPRTLLKVINDRLIKDFPCHKPRSEISEKFTTEQKSTISCALIVLRKPCWETNKL